MIEVSSLPDGTYTLVTHVDPADKIRELGEGNNCVRIPITLTGLGADTPRAALGRHGHAVHHHNARACSIRVALVNGNS